MARKSTKTVAVDSVRHKDKRRNIPTEELRDFVAGDEAQPKTVLYPRDPSLDPQLVWKGKDEQDQCDLAVPAVPVYIQEKIHPHALIEDLRAQAKKDRPEPQIDLFAEKVDFYDHNQLAMRHAGRLSPLVGCRSVACTASADVGIKWQAEESQLKTLYKLDCP